MLGVLKRSVSQLINKGHQRSVKAKKEILYSFLIKGGSILTGFLTVPITLNYIDKEQYGIWITLTSVIAWFSFFDVGLGNGLRNKLSEALASKNYKEAKIYVSSTYAILLVIFIGLLALFLAINPLLNWAQVLNTESSFKEELQLVAAIVFSFFCINFILKLIYSLFYASQRPSLPGLFNFISNFVSLALIFLLTKTTDGSLLNLSLAIGIPPLVVLIFVSILFFGKSYRAIAPSFSFVRKSHFKELLSLGFKFFLVGITGIIIFSTDNMIITQIYSPELVTPYSIAFKYFGLVTSAFAIISSPFWSAYTEAFQNKDFKWILSTNKQLQKIWLLMVVVAGIMLLVSDWFYNLWVPGIEIPFLLSCCMCIYVLALAWGMIFVMFINGVGKVKLQLIVSIIGGIINIPLSYFLAKTCGFGIAGVILASTICIAYGPLFAPFQFRKIMNGTAKGIWNA